MSSRKDFSHKLAEKAYAAKAACIELASAMLINAPSSKGLATSLMEYTNDPSPETKRTLFKHLDDIASLDGSEGTGFFADMSDPAGAARFSATVGLGVGIVVMCSHLIVQAVGDNHGLPEGMDINRMPDYDESGPQTIFNNPEELKAVVLGANSPEELRDKIKEAMRIEGVEVPDDILDHMLGGLHEGINGSITVDTDENGEVRVTKDDYERFIETEFDGGEEG